MTDLSQVFPHDVTIGKPANHSGYNTPEYASTVGDALQWLADMKLLCREHWQIASMSGMSATVIEFKRQKDAMLFKMAFG